jgi:3-oxoacyl-[acyl-carrier protein] reductase
MKTALVTGANTGIGLAIARRLLADGYTLGYATAADEGPYDELRGQYGDDHVVWIHGDLSDVDVAQRLVTETIEATGRIDALVNNAGVAIAKPFLDTTSTSSTTPSPSTFVRPSSRAGGREADARRRFDREHHLVHEHVRAGLAVYAAAKAALGMLSRSLAIELGERDIRVNSVAPGVIARRATRTTRSGSVPRCRSAAPASRKRSRRSSPGSARRGRVCHRPELHHRRWYDPAGPDDPAT